MRTRPLFKNLNAGLAKPPEFTEPTATPAVAAVQPLPAELLAVQDWPASEPAREVVRTLWPDLNYIERLTTAWGNKSAIGLAASIDTIIELPQLLASHARLVAVAAAAEALVEKELGTKRQEWAERYRNHSCVDRELLAMVDALAAAKGQP